MYIYEPGMYHIYIYIPMETVFLGLIAKKKSHLEPQFKVVGCGQIARRKF